MTCKYCGKSIPEDSKFCRYCGKSLNSVPTIPAINTTDKISANNVQVSDDDKLRLQKIYKNAGDSSIALGIVGFLLSVLLSFVDPKASEYLPGTIILSALFFTPLFYFGRKLKNTGTNDLQYSLKLSKGMLIYTSLLIAIMLLPGGFVGVLFFLLLYYYYKAYRETKKVLSH